jgi:UDP-N-acetyl-D-galactosamine dehydrogenase
VPTPVDSDNRPDLGPLEAATRSVAALLDPARKPVIVYESTVYPGSPRRFAGR